jgi:hypothetical protein
MNQTVSSQSLGAVAPYLISAVLLLPPVTATARATGGATVEACTYVDVSQRIMPQSGAYASTYTWELDRPELTPSSLVRIAAEVLFKGYEPFTAAEGWREVRDAQGPFVVEEDPKPAAFFDEYDLSTIALYRQQ